MWLLNEGGGVFCGVGVESLDTASVKMTTSGGETVGAISFCTLENGGRKIMVPVGTVIDCEWIDCLGDGAKLHVRAVCDGGGIAGRNG